MQATDELIKELRELIDEIIPEGGTEKDTRFSDDQLRKILEKSRNLYDAAAECWLRKAAMFQREAGQIRAYSTGQERYEMTDPKNLMEYALQMAQTYTKLAANSMRSIVLRFEPPEVI